jgi:hypothetical protein
MAKEAVWEAGSIHPRQLYYLQRDPENLGGGPTLLAY